VLRFGLCVMRLAFGQRPNTTGWQPVLPRSEKSEAARRRFRSVTELFPLDRARRLGRNIVNDTIDAFDFVNDAIGDAGK